MNFAYSRNASLVLTRYWVWKRDFFWYCLPLLSLLFVYSLRFIARSHSVSIRVIALLNYYCRLGLFWFMSRFEWIKVWIERKTREWLLQNKKLSIDETKNTFPILKSTRMMLSDWPPQMPIELLLNRIVWVLANSTVLCCFIVCSGRCGMACLTYICGQYGNIFTISVIHECLIWLEYQLHINTHALL